MEITGVCDSHHAGSSKESLVGLGLIRRSRLHVPPLQALIPGFLPPRQLVERRNSGLL